MWKDIFSIELANDQYPLLIGIMPLFQQKIKEDIRFDYQFKTLVQNNKITRTQQDINDQNLLLEFENFNDEFKKTELGLVSISLLSQTKDERTYTFDLVI